MRRGRIAREALERRRQRQLGPAYGDEDAKAASDAAWARRQAKRAEEQAERERAFALENMAVDQQPPELRGLKPADVDEARAQGFNHYENIRLYIEGGKGGRNSPAWKAADANARRLKMR